MEHLRKIIGFRVVQKNDLLLMEGDVSRDIFFIVKGLLRCYYVKGSKEVTCWILKEENVVVSVQSFYDGSRSNENIQALELTWVLYISFDQLEDTYLRFPEFNYIGRVLTIKYLRFWNMQLYNLRYHDSRERYDILINGDDRDLINRVPQKYIASYLDMNPETLSRAKK